MAKLVLAKLVLENIEHDYATRPALGPISIQLKAGERVALVGPSGCGKTTLLNIASGLLHPTRGECINLFENNSMMFQQPRLLPWKTALDNIALGLKAHGIKRAVRNQQALELGTQLGLTIEDLQQYPAALSGGMQSRVALARALITQPDLLFLDEAFSALDIGLKAELYRHLRSTLSTLNCSLLMITHDPQEAMRLADRILVLAGSPGQLALEFVINNREQQTDEAWLLAKNQEFLSLDAVKKAFEL